MACFFELTASICRKTNAGALLLVFFMTVSSLQAAQETNAPVPSSDTVITNLAQFWALTADQTARGQLHRAHIALLAYYSDSLWSVFWGHSGDVDTFLPLRGMAQTLKFGDRVLIDGWVLPVNQEFLWDRTTVTVLSESNAVEAIPAQQKLLNTDELKSRFVEIVALVDSSQSISPILSKLSLLSDNVNVDAYVRLDKAGAAWPDWAGKIVRIRGVYSPTLDPFGKISNITLWTAGLNNVEIIGALERDPRFSVPVVTSENFSTGDSETPIRVRGQVRSQQPGEAVTIWDATGQIRILAKQRQPLQLGDRIEAIGYPTFQGLDRVLQMGLFRAATNKEPGDFDVTTNTIKLRLADQVRGLDQESIAQHPQASLQGVITYISARTNVIFVQDSSGGIRVTKTGLQNGRRLRTGMLVTVDGTAAMGEFAPIITNAVIRQTGSMTLPDAPLINLEQALTGTEDGHWIQMRGYVRKVTEKANALELQLVAPGGEFIAHVPKEDAPQAPQGSVVLVHGVCVAVANSRRQLTGVEIWSTMADSVQTEQLAPDDLYALPRRSIASLRQFNLFNTMNKRVHTSGTVTMQVPGRYLCLQEGDNSLIALSSGTERLHPGDRVEVVGFSGNDGTEFLLREAVYRRIAAGPELRPASLNRQTISEDLDGLLVRMDGLLLDAVNKPGEMRLIIQVNDHISEAKLDETAPLANNEPFTRNDLQLGSKITVTGVYRIQRDESGKPLSFLLNLRDRADINVVAPPPWWTLRRLLFILFGGLPFLLLALFWTLQTRRINRQLQRAQVELKAGHDKLEARVEERTRELNEEADARKRALVRLSEAQQRLILASRQAGMAEVATGILHNVGNILNSVNVSATVISDSLKRLRIENFAKAVEIFAKPGDSLATFLTSDPRGRALPGYLRQLAGNMVQNEETMQAEVKSLTKQIDHVKAVVTWQQGYARNSGFYESLNPEELMDDALQINQAALERHDIEVVREYDNPPAITTDRHKVLQILINLLSNAKQAVTASNTMPKRIVVRISVQDEQTIRFEVSDSGVGIPLENLDRIFSLGFTTKPNGHGFGLHSGANSAKEMGGRLFVTSEGTGHGATFVLELPVTSKTAPQELVEMELT